MRAVLLLELPHLAHARRAVEEHHGVAAHVARRCRPIRHQGEQDLHRLGGVELGVRMFLGRGLASLSGTDTQKSVP